jgi:hypothetical protein
MSIRYLQRPQIDPIKWNESVLKSRIPQAYALFDYLDKITNNQWSALVYGDYEAVFPLPMREKFGIRYVVQPVFCQQLGGFGSTKMCLPWILSKRFPNDFSAFV